MRLDKFLKVSRLIKRRTVANELCDAGRVLLNGRPARASAEVKAGDLLEFTLGQRQIRARVRKVEEPVRKEDAAALFALEEQTGAEKSPEER